MPSNQPSRMDPNHECAEAILGFLRQEKLSQYKGTEVYTRVLRVINESSTDVNADEGSLRISQVAQQLRVSAGFARKLCDTGQLPFYLVGKERRVRLADVKDYLRNRKQQSKQIVEEMVDEAQSQGQY
ncbi:MAG: helix-turn-helix domain-containing protein [Chlamydiia bacterium]|nr:helix-turn-helix domain-containing protein [Chlamydiia bacterium]